MKPSLIHFSEAWKTVKGLDLSKEVEKIAPQPTTYMSFFQKLFSACLEPRLSASILTERDHIIAFTKVKYDPTNEFHFRMIHTIYTIMTNEPECRQKGSHWETIGFQSTDPSTDLRSVGMLGVLQILAFITFHKEFLVKGVLPLLKIDEYTFPLCASLLGITKEAVTALRSGKLNSMIRETKSVINCLNNYYFAIFFKFFMVYKLNNLTISDYGHIFPTIVEECHQNPEKTVSEFNTTISIFGPMLYDKPPSITPNGSFDSQHGMLTPK